MPALVDERPTTAEGIVAALSDQTVIETHFDTPENANRWMSEVIDGATAAHASQTASVYGQQTAEILAEMLTKSGFRETDDPERPPVGGGTTAAVRHSPIAGLSAAQAAGFNLDSPDAPAAPANTVWAGDLGRSPGRLMQAAWHNRRPGRDEVLDRAVAELSKVQAAYSSEIGSSGGFLIPEELRSELLRLELEDAVIVPRVTTFPMSTKTLEVPSIDVTSHASSLFGGIVVYWRGEGVAVTESNASFGLTKLEANTVAGLTRIKNENMADTNHLDAYFMSTFPPALAFEKDYVFLQGTGVGQPLGMLNAPGKVTVAAEGGQDAGTLVYQNITKMWARMLPASKKNAIWMVSQSAMPELMEMAMSVGTGGGPVWLTNAASGPPMTIFGRPVFESEKLPAIGTVGDISFVDPRFYLHGDRQAALIESTPYEQFPEGVTTFKVTERYDGRPWFKSALTPKNGGDTLSPVVVLATRA